VKPTSKNSPSDAPARRKIVKLRGRERWEYLKCIPYNDLATGVLYAEIAGITPANVPTKISPGIIHGSHDELKLNQSIRTPVAGIVHGLLNGPKACPTSHPTPPPTIAISNDSRRIMPVM
jgi:hypothetical protein